MACICAVQSMLFPLLWPLLWPFLMQAWATAKLDMIMRYAALCCAMLRYAAL